MDEIELVVLLPHLPHTVVHVMWIPELLMRSRPRRESVQTPARQQNRRIRRGQLPVRLDDTSLLALAAQNSPKYITMRAALQICRKTRGVTGGRLSPSSHPRVQDNGAVTKSLATRANVIELIIGSSLSVLYTQIDEGTADSGGIFGVCSNVTW